MRCRVANEDTSMSLLQPDELHWLASVMHGIADRTQGLLALECMTIAFRAATAHCRLNSTLVRLSI